MPRLTAKHYARQDNMKTWRNVMSQKKLSKIQGVEAACILFSLNTESSQVNQLLQNITEDGLKVNNADNFRREWYGFVHAAVVAGLMVHAPNSVLVDYLRSTSTILKEHGIEKSETKDFVDKNFAPYMEMLGKQEQQNCPQYFFKVLFNVDNLEQAPPRAVALMSATMAMVLSAIADKLEQYHIQSD